MSSHITRVGNVEIHHLDNSIVGDDVAKYIAKVNTTHFDSTGVNTCKLEPEYKYIHVANCTVDYIVDYICNDSNFSVFAEKLRAYVKTYHNYWSKNNVWMVAMQPLLRAALNYIIKRENKWITENSVIEDEKIVQSVVDDISSSFAFHKATYGDKIALVVSDFVTPDIDDACEIWKTLADCFAYMEIGAPIRGAGECIRGGTLMTPEGFSSVLKSIEGPGWRVCELPADGHRCAMVLTVMDQKYGELRMFRKSTGEMLGNEIKLYKVADAEPSNVSSVFECSYNMLTDSIKVIDCMSCNGVSCRLHPLSRRLDLAVKELAKWKLLSNDKSIAVLPYAPPLALVNADHARMVLFVKESEPYDLHCGGSAFLWKQPSLDPEAGQAVLICRNNNAMAVETYKSCMLSSVGPCCSDIPQHMGTYVCVVDWDKNGWAIVRPAKRNERVYTLEEAANAARGEIVTTQITRAGMMRLIKQIDPRFCGMPAAMPQAVHVAQTQVSRAQAQPHTQTPLPETCKQSAIKKPSVLIAPRSTVLHVSTRIKPVATMKIVNAFAALDSCPTDPTDPMDTVDAADITDSTSACDEKKLIVNKTKHKKQ